MNNKKLGTQFEKRICKMLQNDGWWVHFIEPKPDGSQPFDIIAVRYDRAVAIDCKTSITNRFGIDRLQDNQVFAFEKWMKCGNGHPYVIVEYKGKDIYVIPYPYLKEHNVVKLEDLQWAKWGVLAV